MSTGGQLKKKDTGTEEGSAEQIPNPESTPRKVTIGGQEVHPLIQIEDNDDQLGPHEDEDEDEDGDELEDSRDMRVDGLLGREEEEEEVEEARQAKTRAPSKGPSAEQMRVHRLTHYFFQELVSSVRCGKSEELAAFPTRSGR